MTSSPNMLGLYVGLLVGAVFLCYMLIKHKKPPEFMQVAVVILSSTGAIMGIHLGYMALTVEDQMLGGFSDQRVAIVLGALAVTWTAVETTVKTVTTGCRKCLTIKIHSDRQSYASFCALAVARLLHKNTLRFACW